jgi:PTS system nitrogen regulatory IIA component
VAEAAEDISVKEAADFLRVSEKTIYRWIQQGVIPCSRSHGQYRFHRDELEAWARYKRIGSGSGVPAPSEGKEGVDLAEAIRRGGVHYKVEGDSPEAIFRSIVEIFPLSPPRDPEFKEELARTLIEREALASTGVGKGMSIPHPRHPRDWGLAGPVVGVFFLDHPVEFRSFDGEPVYVLFVLLCATVKGHLQMLAQVSHLLREPETQAFLRRVPTRTELLEHIAQVLPPAGHAERPSR